MFFGLIFGILFGFILQRGQFCFVSGFRSLIFQRNLRFISALLIAVCIQSIGLFALSDFGVITIPSSPMPIFATILGGLLFGVGMMLGNCCGSGSWFRSGEGAVGSLLALFAFCLTMASSQTGILKSYLAPLLNEKSALDTLHATFSISPWILTALLLVITAGLILYQRYHPRYAFPAPPSQAVVNHRIFTKHWHAYTTAISLGLLSLVAWYFSAQSGRNYSFGIAVPSANVVQYLVLGQYRFLNWGTLFVLGIPLGSFIAAKLSGEFKPRMPEANAVWQRLLGGFLMGLGASLTGGCTVTNALVATAYFSWQGWLATLMILLGFGIAASFIKPTQCGQ